MGVLISTRNRTILWGGGSPSGNVQLYHLFILFIMKFVQLGTQIKTRCEKKKIYKNTQKVHYEVHKNHIIKSTSDSQNSEI